MPDSLTFWMGKFEARVPTDRLYAQEPSLAAAGGNRQARRASARPTYRVGFTAYSVRLLQDVFFLDWTIDPGTAVAKGRADRRGRKQQGALDALPAVRRAPCSASTTALLADPSAINADGYGGGWLYEFQPPTSSSSTPAAYLRHLDGRLGAGPAVPEGAGEPGVSGESVIGGRW